LTALGLFADLDLARRLEGAEGHASAMFVEARARTFPNGGYEWLGVGTARAMYDGLESPITQTFGFGLGALPAAQVLDELEAFFEGKGAPAHHEVSPLADLTAMSELVGRGYQPVEYTSVMYRPLADLELEPVGAADPFEVREIRSDEGELWADTTVLGWSDYPELEPYLRELVPVSTRREDSVSILAFLDGEPAATGAMSLHGGVMLLAGACTVPEARRQGAQKALLEFRLRHAVDRGCDVAMMCAQPGSASQRNAERQGFRIAYTRLKWRKPEPLDPEASAG
jgi:GNAT superfamily N-acetyltransferase